jgi:hypothetical protein
MVLRTAEVNGEQAASELELEVFFGGAGLPLDFKP